MANSPKYIRTSLAAAITLKMRPGLFWRGAKLHCINLLLVYDKPCAGNCAYCGLHRQRREPRHAPATTKNFNRTDKTFIRVDWPIFDTDDVIARTVELEREQNIQRVCISMLTRKECVEHTIDVIERYRQRTDIPISILASPMVTTGEDLVRFRDAGADKIGVAVDAATPQLFEKYRGKSRGAPHKWDRYWEFFRQAVKVFGKDNVGSHLIVGLGESEMEMVKMIQLTKQLGRETHLFSFYPEEGSDMENHTPPPIDRYRRVQIARYLIDNSISSMEKMKFCPNTGNIMDFGISPSKLDEIIDTGYPFMTSGCTGRDGKTVACNRPFGNSPPGPGLRNYPFVPSDEDIKLIRYQLETGNESFEDEHDSAKTEIHSITKAK
ncbi:radical SAM protein [bacterium]|nr:MAG: radical SAM protein [bacterium]